MTDEEREQKWQAEGDARTLALVEEIKADKARYKRAIKAAQEIKKELEARTRAIQKIAKSQIK